MHVSSYLSPKVAKGAPSPIQGRGLFAVQPIRRDEIVAIKGGHVVDAVTLAEHAEVVGNSDVKIADGLFLAALEADEYEDVMLFLNHSCEPNVGVGGNIVFVAMRDIAVGEELTIDYAMIDDDTTRLDCRCGQPTCRRVISGQDWRRPELQAKYGAYFSWYLLRQMRDQG